MFASIAAGCGFTGPSLQAADDGGVDGALSPAVVTFASAMSTQDEMSGAFQVEVSLSRASATPITVDYALVDHSGDGWATPGTDFSGGNGSITFAPGEMIKGIDLTIISDNEDEAAESFELALTSATGDATLGDVTSHTVTISAFILPRVSFTTATGNGMESTTSVPLVLSLNTMATSDVTVGYTVSGSAALRTAAFPDHSLAATGTATIPAGMTTLPLPVTITNDTTDEDAEHLVVTLSSSTNAVVDTTHKQYDYTIDDDDAPPNLTFETASIDVTQDEAAVDVTLHAKLSARSEKAISVPFAQNTVGVADPATATDDFTYTTPGPLTWSAGTTTLIQDIVLHVVDDDIDEFDEHLQTVFGTPANPANVNIPAGTKSTVTITDLDAQPVAAFDPNTGNLGEIGETDTDHDHDFNVLLDAASGKPISITVNVSGSATYDNPDMPGTPMGWDFTTRAGDIPVTFAPGETMKTIRLTVRGDDFDDGSGPNKENVGLTLDMGTNVTIDPDMAKNQRTLTIVDDD